MYNEISLQIRAFYCPRDAYRAMKDSPFISIVVSYIVLLLGNSILTEVLSLAMAGERELIFIPLFIGTVGLLIGAAIIHAAVVILKGRSGFLKTLSVVMYGVTPLLLTSWVFGILGDSSVIVILGVPLLLYLFLFCAWSIILIILGLQEVQELTLLRSALAAGIAFAILLVILVLSGLCIFWFIQGHTGLSSADTPSLQMNIHRVNDSILVTNLGFIGTSGDRITRLEVSLDGNVQGELGIERNSTLKVYAPSCPAEVSVDAYYENNENQNIRRYREESCPNSFVNLSIIRNEESIEIVNDGGPRLNEVLEFSVDAGDGRTYQLGNKPDSSVTIPAPDQIIEVTITAKLTNGGSWQIATTHLGPYRKEDWSHRYSFLVQVTPAPLEMCAQEGERIGAVGMPTHCCEGLDPIGGWPGGYTGSCLIMPPPGGLSICSDCGDRICNASTGENHCNCEEDCG
jgi:hypothetical protein